MTVSPSLIFLILTKDLNQPKRMEEDDLMLKFMNLQAAKN